MARGKRQAESESKIYERKKKKGRKIPKKCMTRAREDKAQEVKENEREVSDRERC